MEWLINAAELPNVRVWVLPFSSVTYAGLDGKFTILTLGDGSEVVYVEGPDVGQLIDDPDTVADCALRFDLVMGEALRSDESLMLIRRTLDESLMLIRRTLEDFS